MRRGCQQGPTINNCSYGLYNCVPWRTRIRRRAIDTLHKPQTICDNLNLCGILSSFKKCTLLSDGSNTILLNIEQTQPSLFKHWTNSNVFIYWWSNSNTWILALNEWTSKLGHKSPLLNYSSNRLQHHCFEYWTDLNVFIFC